MDRDRLQHLIDQHYARVRRTALALCGDPWEADEIAQETFLAAIDAARTFRADASESTWLYGICLRIYRSRFRSTIRRMRRSAVWLLRTGRGEAAPPADYLSERLQWQQSLWASVARLPPAHREVVVLRFIEGMSVADIARAVGCPTGTVKSRLHHAMGKLRGWLSEDSFPASIRPTHSPHSARRRAETARVAASVTRSAESLTQPLG